MCISSLLLSEPFTCGLFVTPLCPSCQSWGSVLQRMQSSKASNPTSQREKGFAGSRPHSQLCYWCHMSIESLLMQSPPASSRFWMSNGHGYCPCWHRTCLDQGSLRSLKGGNFQDAPGKRWNLNQQHFGKSSPTETGHSTIFTGKNAGVHRFPDGSAIGWLSLVLINRNA